MCPDFAPNKTELCQKSDGVEGLGPHLILRILKTYDHKVTPVSALEVGLPHLRCITDGREKP